MSYRIRFQALLLAAVVTLPLHMVLAHVCLVAFCVNSLTAPRTAWAGLVRRDSMLWVVAPLLVVCTASLAWSQDLLSGLATLETMGSLAVVSVALGREHLTPRFLPVLYRAFVATITGCAIAALVVGLVKFWQYDGWYRYYPGGDVRNHHLFYTGLSDPVMHPGYFAVYVGIAVLLVARLSVPARRKWPFWLLGGFLTVFLLMLQGRINILSFAAVTLPWIAWQLVRRHHPLALAGMVAALVVTSVGAVRVLPGPVADRFTESVSVDYDVTAPRIGEFSGLTIRFAEWESIWPVVAGNWMTGVGIGDAHGATMWAYQESGFVVGSRREFNVHNQLLQTWLESGLLGLLALLFVLGAASWVAVRRRDVVLAMAFWYFFLSSLTESMLERNWGGSVFGTLLFVLLVAAQPWRPSGLPDRGVHERRADHGEDLATPADVDADLGPVLHHRGHQREADALAQRR